MEHRNAFWIKISEKWFLCSVLLLLGMAGDTRYESYDFAGEDDG